MMFRVYDPTSNRMIEETSGIFMDMEGRVWKLEQSPENGEKLITTSLIPMLSTKAKDKNKKEMYQDDLVRIDDDPRLYRVVYKQGSFWYCWSKPEEGKEKQYPMKEVSLFSVEVVGNVHEGLKKVEEKVG